MSSIKIDTPIDLDPRHIAYGLKNRDNKEQKTDFLNEFLGELDDESYAVVVKFVSVNPL